VVRVVSFASMTVSRVVMTKVVGMKGVCDRKDLGHRHGNDRRQSLEVAIPRSSGNPTKSRLSS
jgi:hypothetical protein